MTHCVEVFFFSAGLLDSDLKFALYLSQKEVVDHDVVGGLIQFVFDSDQLKLAPHCFTAVQHVKGFEETGEAAFRALQFGPKEVADPKNHQVDVLVLVLSVDLLTRPQKVVNEDVRVAQHEGSQNGAHLRRQGSRRGIPANEGSDRLTVS